MENLKHEKSAIIGLNLFKDYLSDYFKTGEQYSMDRASAYKEFLLAIGYTQAEIDTIVKELRNEK